MQRRRMGRMTCGKGLGKCDGLPRRRVGLRGGSDPAGDGHGDDGGDQQGGGGVGGSRHAFLERTKLCALLGSGRGTLQAGADRGGPQHGRPGYQEPHDDGENGEHGANENGPSPRPSLKKVSSAPQRSLSAIQTPLPIMSPAAVRKAGDGQFHDGSHDGTLDRRGRGGGDGE